jgi:tetratricopeptide (TPR) repeat protein
MGKNGETFESELRAAADLLARGLVEAAQLRATQALALRPRNVLAKNLHAIILFRALKFQNALEIFESLVRKNADVVALRLNAGLAALQLGNLERALEHFRRAVDIDPGHRRAFGYIALIHLLRGEQDLARAALFEARLDDLAARLQDLDAGGSEDSSSERTTRALIQELEQKVPGLPPLPGTQSPEAEGGAIDVPPTADTGFIEAVPMLGPQAQHPIAPSGERETAEHLRIDLKAKAAALRSCAAVREPRPTQLKERLAELALPCLADASTATLHAGGLLVLRFAHGTGALPEGAFVRGDRLVLESGALRWTEAQRRRKGAEAGPFLCEESKILCGSGEGTAILHPGEGYAIELLHLEGEALFLRESSLVAFSSALHYENGRIPGASAFGPPLVHIRGTGFLAIRSVPGFGTVPVLERDGLRTRLDCVLGWTPDVLPQEITSTPTGQTIGFSGCGMVLVSFGSMGENERGS